MTAPAPAPASAAAGPPPHADSAADVARALGTDPAHGLTAAAVAERRAACGPNRLVEAPRRPAWKRFLDQFRQLVILILVAAAAVSGALGDWTDTVAILAIVVLNGLIGFLQEQRADRSLAALRRLSAPKARVVRDGVPLLVPASELVPGDRVELEAGDRVPADARLLRAFALRVQEGSLTGESSPVGKGDEPLPESTPLADRRNMVYLGTVVAAGKGSAVVVATGMATELGRIAGMLQRSEPEPTPLQRRLDALGRVLVFVCLAAVLVIFGLQTARGERLIRAFMTAVGLAVAAVPEGLPAVVTVALALGVQRMARRNALVRKLPGVEALGSVTVICTDKTGTLTRNEMTVREVRAGGRGYRVTGAGYAPRGMFWPADGDDLGGPVDPAAEPDLSRVLEAGARCNNARVGPRRDDSGAWDVVGDPTEGALLVAALKAGIDPSTGGHQVVYEVPFDAARRAMSVVDRAPGGAATVYTKGAPEVVLGWCAGEWRDGRVVPLTDARRAEVAAESAAMAARALRVLALADRPLAPGEPPESAESGLTFAGLVGMIDPPRDEAKAAVAHCRTAGIRPVMITGDHPDTARAIAAELGIAGHGGRALTGAEVDAMDDRALAAGVGHVAVFARVSAEHKLRVVRAWQARGEVVAMTGDGVNDAPAVQAADVGIAMGRDGTDVTREASDVVLTDDNFASIVAAVEEGRGIFDNIQKFVLFLLACNTGEVLFVLLAAVVGWPAPLTAVQLLWVNLVTDGLPALALGMEPPERDLMRRRPRHPRAPVVTPAHGAQIVAYGTLIAGVTAFGFARSLHAHGLEHAQTVALCILAYSQLFFSVGCRSQTATLPQLGPFSNPVLFAAIAVSALLQYAAVTVPVARTVLSDSPRPVAPGEWPLVLGLALIPVTLIEVSKLLRFGTGKRRRAPAAAGVAAASDAPLS